MTTTAQDARALIHIAKRLREDTYGLKKWDENGTYAIISKLVGQQLADVTERVVRHALDPEARTPAAINRPFLPAAPPPQTRGSQPPKRSEECDRHQGQLATNCGGCRADELAGDEPRRAEVARPCSPEVVSAGYRAAKDALLTARSARCPHSADRARCGTCRDGAGVVEEVGADA